MEAKRALCLVAIQRCVNRMCAHKNFDISSVTTNSLLYIQLGGVFSFAKVCIDLGQ